MSESAALAWSGHSPACYHEPRVHDHQLYFQLRDLNLYFLLPISLLGIALNAGAMIFLYRPPKITSGVFVYLKALLILDHVLLVVKLATEFLPLICDLHHSANHTFYDICMFERRFLKHTMPRIETTISTMHVWCIAALSAHRYWKISRPVIARLKDTVGRAHTMLFGMLASALLFRTPIFALELEILSPYRFIYHSVLEPLMGNIVPFALMSIFSLLTLYEIYRSRHLSYQQIGFGTAKRTSLTHPLTSCFRQKAEVLRQKQELRATVSIVAIILLYLVFHSLKLYTIIRKWQLLINHQCPNRSDYFQSHLSNVLCMVSASVNAFVFIAFTNRLKKYVRLLLRKTSRTLSNSSDPPLSPKTTVTIDAAHHFNVNV
ncbi:unnamed protein product [Caenorhabditis auriculariae]|uniref:G-protein coupled receptors family 1 profile domain-containing protein n=1 Tax=Caenorhabditis auriculariae TaxID=2777116 RepID=A0A8S1HFP2_9PELO|nr:unnamed protein product [Caenorhabditis auriculariae]